MCLCRTSLSVLHLAGVSLRLREDAGGSSVPLQLVHTSVRKNAAKDRSALQISCKKARRRKVATSQLNRDQERKFIKYHNFFLFNLPGLHFRVRIVWILILLLMQKPPSVYTSLMSFPTLVFWGDERKLPRLMALLFLSGERHDP